MIRFSVPDISCDACVRAIAAAIGRIDDTGAVGVDLAGQLIEIDTQPPAGTLADATATAGFSPHPVAPFA